MTQISITALDERAKQLGTTLKAACLRARVAESTASRARRGSDLKLGTFNKLSQALDEIEASQAEAR
jgi:hypothetical protein